MLAAARPARGAAGVAALLVVAKLFLFPVLVWLLLARRRTGLVAAGGVTAGVLAAGWLLGPLGPAGY